LIYLLIARCTAIFSIRTSPEDSYFYKEWYVIMVLYSTLLQNANSHLTQI